MLINYNTFVWTFLCMSKLVSLIFIFLIVFWLLVVGLTAFCREHSFQELVEFYPNLHISQSVLKVIYNSINHP